MNVNQCCRVKIHTNQLSIATLKDRSEVSTICISSAKPRLKEMWWLMKAMVELKYEHQSQDEIGVATQSLV